MKGLGKTFWAIRRLSRAVLALALATVLTVLMIAPGHAAPPLKPADRASAPAHPLPYIVRTDYGGSVKERLLAIQTLRAANRRVEIRGTACLSSCTMLLGLKNVCVMPNTVFGFHGPSRRGVPLEKALFDRVSIIIAQHYPRALQGWYMDHARFSLTTLHRLTGADLIEMGAATACDQPLFAHKIQDPRANAAG